MDKIIQALSKLLPQEQLNEVTSAVKEMIEESKKELEAEYDKNLEEAYKQMAAELAESEKTAEEGYMEAYAIIKEQEASKEAMKAEMEKMLEEQYEEAYKMILEERGKNTDIESTMYEEYDNKLNEIKEYIVDKVDQFLQQKGKDIYEQAYRDALNDPRMAEHKVVLDKIVELTSDYLSEEELQFATSHKLEEAHTENDKLKSQLRTMEGRNIRISAENTKLQTKLNEAVSIIKETVTTDAKQEKINEQKERVKKAANVQGRGHAVSDEKLIAEFKGEPEVTEKSEEDNTLVEHLVDDLEFAKKVAGIK